MKKVIVCTGLMLLLVSFTGCNKNLLPERREIDDLQLVQIIGIDKLPEEPDSYLITIASKNLEGEAGQQSSGSTEVSSGSSVGGEKALVLSSTGNTIFDAVRKLQTHSNKTLFWGHSYYYLIGEEAARDNISKFIDFFTRDHELRIESKLYVVKDSTAKDLIEQFNEGDYYILDKLDSLERNMKFLSISKEMKMHELMKFLDIHHASARIPCIHLVNRDEEENKQIKDIETCGYAILSNLKLVGFIGPEISRGMNLITNTVNSSIVTVKDITGQKVSLEIISSKTDVIPYFNGDNLERILLKTKVVSNLGEIHSQVDFANKDYISYIESQQSEILKNEMEKVLKKVLEFKSDCLNICDGVRLKNPLKWHKIEDKWMEILPEIKFDVQVISKVKGTYELSEPSGYKWRKQT